MIVRRPARRALRGLGAWVVCADGSFASDVSGCPAPISAANQAMSLDWLTSIVPTTNIAAATAASAAAGLPTTTLAVIPSWIQNSATSLLILGGGLLLFGMMSGARRR